VQDEVGGAGDVGFARGSFKLSFDYDGQSYESEGTYFTLLRHQEDGDWRISRRTWNDHRRSTSD
jgi:ketosteroid isomerase-like protein